MSLLYATPMLLDKMKTYLPITLKILFSLALVFWLLSRDKLDFSLVFQSFRQGYHWTLCIALLTVQYIGSAFRWKLLLQTQTRRPLPWGKTIGVTWIGLFFNSFLPGSVTGDVIKVFYAKKLDPHFQKSFLLSSIFMDRFVGLLGLLLILGISCITFHKKILSFGAEMDRLLTINATILGFSGIALFTIFAPTLIQQFILKHVSTIPLLGEKLASLIRQIWFMGKNKKVFLQTLGISLILQFINILAFYTISSPFYGKDIPLYYAITFIPLGMMSIAIPLSPAGLGVGHLIFDQLFAWAGIEGGASLFNLYFLVSVALNSLGIFPYILSNKRNLQT